MSTISYLEACTSSFFAPGLALSMDVRLSWMTQFILITDEIGMLFEDNFSIGISKAFGVCIGSAFLIARLCFQNIQESYFNRWAFRGSASLLFQLITFICSML